MEIQVKDIINAVESVAPPVLQESWDNTGLQVGHPSDPVTGVMTVVDVRPEYIGEAARRGLNMVVSHHPLIFKGLKSLTGATPVQQAVELAIRLGIAVYSSHTALDNTEGGVSHAMARRLGMKVESVLSPLTPAGNAGSGVVAAADRALSPAELAALAKKAFGCATVRCSDPQVAPSRISRVAMCGGAGGSFIDDALKVGADAYITGDLRYHDFVDYAGRIFLVDCGHFETEELTRDLFASIITSQFPELPVHKSEYEHNPVKYL